MICQNCRAENADLIECDGSLVVYCQACRLSLCKQSKALIYDVATFATANPRQGTGGEEGD